MVDHIRSLPLPQEGTGASDHWSTPHWDAPVAIVWVPRPESTHFFVEMSLHDG